MIELGSMPIRDEESVTGIRSKVLGLLRSLRADEVLATRVATGVSEMTRRYLHGGGGASCRVLVGTVEGRMTVRLQMEGSGRAPDTGPLRVFCDVPRERAVADGRHEVQADVEIGGVPIPLTEGYVAREQARIQQRSRRELSDELRIKNAQLEEYNESLEVTVARRTEELTEANAQMRRDLNAGAEYVRGLIPPPERGRIAVDWRYIPSSSLGGDTIGYHWLDDRRFAMYLIDVTGHGLDSALLAVTITNVLRAGSLPGVDMRRPEEVLFSLNEAFQGERHGMKFFTIWYGVYDAEGRSLTWSGGGHHPSVLVTPGGREALVLLESGGPLMGVMSGIPFPSMTREVAPGTRLLIFSDGVFEIIRDEKVVWSLNECNEYLASCTHRSGSLMDALLAEAARLQGEPHFEDDVSLIEAEFL